jgi:hypothetical protein
MITITTIIIIFPKVVDKLSIYIVDVPTYSYKVEIIGVLSVLEN